MSKSNPAQSDFRKVSTIEVQRLALPGRGRVSSESSPHSISVVTVFDNPTIAQSGQHETKPKKKEQISTDIEKTQYVHRPEAHSDERTCYVHRPEVDRVFRTRPHSRHETQSKTIPIIRHGKIHENKRSKNSVGNVPTPKDEWPLAWLVAITGPMKGKFFVITAGENNIGQTSDNAICLIDNPDVSARQNSIHYDAEHTAFYIDKCENAQQVTTLSDGDTVNSRTPLEHGEILRVSPNTKLRFVPFCSETFNW